METSQQNSRENVMSEDEGVVKLKNIKMEDTFSHSGLAALAAAAADETAQLATNSNNKHTNRKTGADMKIFLSYLISANEPRAPQNISEVELDKYLCSFFMTVKKTDRSEYEPCSLRSMLASIERYLKINGYPSSLTKDMSFANTRYTLKVKQKILREMGKGAKPNHNVNITSLKDKSLDRVFEAREMGPYSPASIAQTLCFVFVVYLKLRKATEHKKLLWGDVILDKDQNGREYITFSEQMLQRCTLQYLKQCQPVVYALPDTPERDPVRIYKIYSSKRTPTMNYQYAPFYLGINIFNPTDNQSWYKSIAMGINKLNDMVRQVREVTGMTQTSSLSDTPESPQDLSLSSVERHSQSATPEPHVSMSGQSLVSSNHQYYGAPCNNNNTGAIGNCNPIKEESPDCTVEYDDLSEHHSDTYDENEEMRNKDSFYVEPIIESSDDTSDVDENGGDQLVDQDVSGSSIEGIDTDNHEQYHETFNKKESPVSCICLKDAKKKLEHLVNQLQSDDEITRFKKWLKNIDIVKDKHTGKLVCEETDECDAKTIHPPDTEQQIILNITLSNKAFRGEQPVTVTATSKFVNSTVSAESSGESVSQTITDNNSDKDTNCNSQFSSKKRSHDQLKQNHTKIIFSQDLESSHKKIQKLTEGK